MRQYVIAIIERYLGSVRRFSGESNITMICPFHKGGQEATPSFSVNADLGLFHCFTCKASGSIPKLLAMLGLPKSQIDTECQPLREGLEQNRIRLLWRRRAAWYQEDPMKAKPVLPEKILAPYEWCPTSLVSYGFREDLLRHLDIGFDRINNRITYPIRDLYGNIAGVVGGAAFAGQQPKYKVYKGKWKDPQTGNMMPSDYGLWFEEEYPDYDFRNHDYIWNFDQVYPRLFFGKEENQTLIIAEGYKAALWLLQNGYWNTVALMGSSMSDRQFSVLHRLSVRYLLFLDNDNAGAIGTFKIGKRLFTTTPEVFVARYPEDADDAQPDNLTAGELSVAINQADTFPQYMKENRYGINGRAPSWSDSTQQQQGR